MVRNVVQVDTRCVVCVADSGKLHAYMCKREVKQTDTIDWVCYSTL